jgi:transcriptional regulator with PAS, ATPase and Fis domain
MGINCAALSETLLEGELFGYERGAFTGAVQARAGLFEAADGGSVFLDEVGELAPSTQAKLLRVLEERAVMRLGARSPRKIDVRFIAATNRDLQADATAGRFRKDLYFRLNGISLTIPPLRERREDIEPLVTAFVAQACRQLDREAEPEVSHELLELLRGYSWPGNVRELRNVIERAVVLSTQPTLGAADLPLALLDEAEAPGAPPIAAQPAATIPPADALEPKSMRDEIRSLERSRIVIALERCGGNQTQAAKLLGISRRTLISRLGEFGLRPGRKSPNSD